MTLRSRIFGLISALAVLVVPTMSYAADAAFNTLPDDFATLQVRNTGSAWGTSASAKAGDTLDLLVWDHNSVPGSTAHNVTVKVALPNPTTDSMAHAISASVSADNAATVTGNVLISTNGMTKLSYVPGSAVLYKNVPGNDGSKSLVQTSWPTNVNPDNVVAGGVNLGDQEGCWQYAQAVLIKVKLDGPIVIDYKSVLSIKKEVRRTSNDAFGVRATANPGNRVEYKVSVTNVDANGVAHQVKLTDILPTGVTYVAGSGKLVKPNGETVSVSDGVTAGGVVVLDNLKPGETLVFTFFADTAATFTDGTCAKNTVKVTADNTTNSPDATADVCFVVVRTEPTPAPKPTPKPELPHTGPEMNLLGASMLSGLGLSTSRYALLKRKLQKRAKSLDIV
jgi:uncharacterized repeat protein (TIGR01451 family)